MTNRYRAVIAAVCLTAMAAHQPAVAAPPASPEPKLALPPPPPPPSLAAATVKTEGLDRARFRMFETQNVWTLLMLDTRTGRLWQVQTSLNANERFAIPVSTAVWADGEDGRFSLTMTKNIWTGVLVDTKNGRVWQCQFGMKESQRFCEPIDLESKQ
jgi:hypothetical protein